MVRRITASRILLCVAVCGALPLFIRGDELFVLALYGTVCGSVVGAVRRGTRGCVEGSAFGLLAGLISPICYTVLFWRSCYTPLSWLIDLPNYPPGR